MKHRDKRARTLPKASAPAETAGGGKSNAVLVAVARAIPLSEPTTGPPSDLPDECATPHSITTTAPCPEEAKAASPGRPAVYAPYEARSTFQGAWAGRVFKLGELGLGYYEEGEATPQVMSFVPAGTETYRSYIAMVPRAMSSCVTDSVPSSSGYGTGKPFPVWNCKKCERPMHSVMPHVAQRWAVEGRRPCPSSCTKYARSAHTAAAGLTGRDVCIPLGIHGVGCPNCPKSSLKLSPPGRCRAFELPRHPQGRATPGKDRF